MASVWHDTLKRLREAAADNETCLVAYSGGKDSLAVMELCARTFRRVLPFFMYLVPDLACVNEQLDYCKERWGVKPLLYPHWCLFRDLKRGMYADEHWSRQKLPDIKLLDVYSLVRHETKTNLLATGAKESDSTWRRKVYFASTKHWDWALYPLQKWNKFDVVAFLKTAGIPLPDSSNRQATGIDLSTPSLLWLHDNHPDDFQKLLRVFPFAETVVWRRKFHGIE